MYVGSDVKEITYNNPTVGSGSLYCKAGDSSNIDLGGIRNTDDKAMITGDGQKIGQKTQSRSHFELPPIAWDKTDKNELQKLNDLAASSAGTQWTIQYLDGSIFQMENGDVVGDIVGDGYAGTIPLTLQGNANASRIS